MPILWRYLIKNYFKYFCLTLFVFIATLIIVRFQDIARFATLGASLFSIIKFTLFQIPIMLPIAIPLSSIITSYILMNRLSLSEELTAFRALGLSIHQIAYPIYGMSLVLALLNFASVSEVTPRTIESTKSMLTEIIYHNPLLLLKKNRLIKVKDSYMQMDMIQSGKEAKNIVFAFKNPHHQISLVCAKKLMMNEGGELLGEDLSIIQYLNTHTRDNFDHLIIENQQTTLTDPKAFWLLTNAKDKKLSISQFPTSQLIKLLKEKKNTRALVEIIKRISLSLSVIAYTFLTVQMAVRNGREPSKVPSIILFIVVTTTFALFLAARSFTHSVISPILYIVPLILICLIGFIRHRQIIGGKCD